MLMSASIECAYCAVTAFKGLLHPKIKMLS